MIRHLCLVGLIVLLFAPLAVRAGDSRLITLTPNNKPIPSSLFNLNLIGIDLPTVPCSTIRTFRATWWLLEPEKGRWTFNEIDNLQKITEKAGFDLMPLLQTGPHWASSNPNGRFEGRSAPPRDLNDWRDYVRTLATHFKGRIHIYELWNEPNTWSFAGTPEQLADLARVAYETLKEVDPTITVVSSGIANSAHPFEYLDRYFAAGGGKYADVIGFHFYASPHPEDMLLTVDKVHAVMRKYGITKPLWSSEAGWNVSDYHMNELPTNDRMGEALPTDQLQGTISRAFILAWASGLERYFWYNWGGMPGLGTGPRHPKSALAAWKTTHQWLVGAVMNSCQSSPDNTWVCQLLRNGSRQYIVWNVNSTLTFNIPKDWQVTQMQDLNGVFHPLNGRTLLIGPAPRLLQLAPK